MKYRHLLEDIVLTATTVGLTVFACLYDKGSFKGIEDTTFYKGAYSLVALTLLTRLYVYKFENKKVRTHEEERVSLSEAGLQLEGRIKVYK
tara:strand:+ start:660 stop:932 length:273 start_codon:yes stop_codon:yes gene_type:complete